MPLRDNKIVLGTAFAARAYSKIVLDGDFPGAFADISKAIETLGLKDLLTQSQQALFQAALASE
jgi:hypothetical protein